MKRKEKKSVLVKIMRILYLSILLVFATINFSFAGSLAESKELNAIASVVIIGIVIIIGLIPFFTFKGKDINIKSEKNEKKKENEENKSIIKNQNFNIYATIFVIILCLIVLFEQKTNITLSIVISLISLVFMIIFAKNVDTERKQKKIEQEGKMRTVSEEKIYNRFVVIRNALYVCFLSISVLNFWSADFLIIFVVFLIASFLLKIQKDKKSETIICCIAILIVFIRVLCTYIMYIKTIDAIINSI